MKSLMLWLVLAIPKQKCLDKDKSENYGQVIDPLTKITQVVRIRGQEPTEKMYIQLSTPDWKEPSVAIDENCYDVYFAKIPAPAARLWHPREHK